MVCRPRRRGAHLTGGEILGDLNPGSVVDVPNLIAGITVGILKLVAAVWVVHPGRIRAAIAWLGILAGFAPFAWLFWIALNTASRRCHRPRRGPDRARRAGRRPHGNSQGAALSLAVRDAAGR